MSISKIFLPNFVCVVQMKDIKHIRWDFHSDTLVMPQGAGGAQGGGVKFFIFFFKHGHVAYLIDGDDEQNKMQVKFHPRVKLVTLG